MTTTTTTMMSSAAVFPRQHYGRALGLSSPSPPSSSPSSPHPHPPYLRCVYVYHHHHHHHHHHLGRFTNSTSPFLFAAHHQTWGTALSVLPRCTPRICGPSYAVPHGAAAATIWGPPQPLLRRRSRVAAAGAGQGKQPSSSKKEDKLVTEGLITELLPNCMFRVRLDNGDVILGYVSGKMRTKMVRVLVGDRVKIEFSRYDSTRGRIVYRLRSTKSPSTPDQ